MCAPGSAEGGIRTFLPQNPIYNAINLRNAYHNDDLVDMVFTLFLLAFLA